MKFCKMLTALFLVLAVGAVAEKPPKPGMTPVSAVAKAVPAKHKYSAAQAQAIALKKYPGKVYLKTKLGKEKGKWDYAVYIQSGKGRCIVLVGADTGKIDGVHKGMKKTASMAPTTATANATPKAKTR